MSRVDHLLGVMTLTEKIGQLTMAAAGSAVTGPITGGNILALIRSGTVGNLLNLVGPAETRRAQRVAVEETRLGIPLLLGFDVIHGHRTIFPIPLGEAASFDPGRWEQTARLAAIEAAADGVSLTFAPMLDVARDPRWGRIAEGTGEDPGVASRYAVAKVRGFHGAGLDSATAIATTAKHFCAYGAVTAGRDYAPVDLSDRTLAEVYLPPFEAAVRAGVAAVMPAFTDLAGVPMTSHSSLLNGWLRTGLRFDGVIISDYNAIAELVMHGVAADIVEAATLALKAGVDIDMMGDAFGRGLPAALERGLVSMEHVDASVRRVLRLKERLGLFDRPYRDAATTTRAAIGEDARALARDVARRAIVLLANEGTTLPLPATTARIAVVGPLADARADMLGPWSGAGRAADVVTILDGLRAALPKARIDHEPGVAFDDAFARSAPDQMAAALDLCRSADVVLLCVGEPAAMSGEAASRSSLDLPGRQRAFAEAVLDLGRPVVAILSSGRPLAVPWLTDRAAATLATWFLGIEAGHAIADVLLGHHAPTGRLPVSWPRSVGQVPIFFGQRPGGRPVSRDKRSSSGYRDFASTPQFPFGHGLSYTHFTLSNAVATVSSGTMAEAVDIRVDVANAGPRFGEETVFLFAAPGPSPVSRPVLSLKGIGKIALEPGETGTLRISMTVGPSERPLRNGVLPALFVGQSADTAALLDVVRG